MPGPQVDRRRETARENGIFVSIGISEASPASVGCLWNSNLLIGAVQRMAPITFDEPE